MVNSSTYIFDVNASRRLRLQIALTFTAVLGCFVAVDYHAGQIMASQLSPSTFSPFLKWVALFNINQFLVEHMIAAMGGNTRGEVTAWPIAIAIMAMTLDCRS